MSPTPPQNQPVSWPQILTVALLAIGAIAAQWDIQPDRPIPSGQGVDARSVQDIDARLWQDPFGPVSKADKSRKLGELSKMVQKHDAKVRVIAVLVSGGKWVGADEARRRVRYATLSGLQVEGYTPHDPEHVGYVEEEVLGTDLRMPYEWMEYDGPDEKKTELVLVLWVDEDALLVNAGSRLRDPLADKQWHGPLARLKEIRSRIVSSKNFPFTIVGPSSSTLLVTANEEIAAMKKKNGESPWPDTLWYSPLATLPDEKVKGLLENNPYFRFTRLIATDDRLAEALVKELERRQVTVERGIEKFVKRLHGIENEGPAIALLFQRDTAYSRELLAQVKSKLDAKIKPIEFGYLRGIDGRLPGSADEKDRKKDDEKKDSRSKETGPSTLERPEGDAQIDYLRRLVAELQTREREEGPIKAIGILGDDYYDKLLIMKALHPAFPQAVFFTTDLNAAMLHPKDNRDTRNLVVASGYGLTLVPDLQRDVPPFRDSYQTASFLAARIAASSPKDPAFKGMTFPAQIFEIGRNAAVPLTGPPQSGKLKTAEISGSLPVPAAEWRAAFWLPIVVTLLLIMLRYWDASNIEVTVPLRTSDVAPRSRLGRWAKHRYLLFVLAAFAMAAALSIGLIAWLRANPEETEPFSWVQGISIWPSEMLRLTALVLSIGLIWRGRRLLASNREYVESRFKLKAETDAPTTPEDKEKSAVEIWRCYVGNGKAVLPYLHVPRVRAYIGFVVAMLCSGLLLSVLLPLSVPSTPARGNLTFFIDILVLLFTLGAFWTLLFFAIQKTLRANWLARKYAKRTLWPREAYEPYWPKEIARDIDPRIFSDWLDVRLIAHATEPIQRIVFYPFLVLALIIFARTSLFDGWHNPLFLYIMFGVPVVLMVAVSWPLRAKAESVREKALRWLHVRLMEEQASGRDKVASQLKTMIAQVEHLKTGAFAPFSERPLFKGFLTLVGSASGFALLDYANQLGF